MVSPTSGSGTAILTLTASANTQVESRTATVTIGNEGNPSQAITVLQAGIIVLGTTNPTDASVTIYPNPVSSKLYIRDLPPKATLIIYDLVGNVRQQQGSVGSTWVLDTDTLSPGMHYLRIQSEQQTLTKPFLKLP